MPVIHERRVKGVEFDSRRYMPDDIADDMERKYDIQKRERARNSTKEHPYIYNPYSKRLGKSSTTSVGKDIEDSKLNSRIESLDKEAMQYILESDNIVEEYNEWIDFKVSNIIRKAKNNKLELGSGSIELMIQDICDDLMTKYNMSEGDIHKYIKNTYFYTTDNPNNIKLLIKLRIKYCEKITNLLTRMLQNNYKLLGIYNFEVESLIQDIENGSTDKKRVAINKIKDKIYANLPKFYKNDNCLDLTSLGFGKIFFAHAASKDLLSEYLNARYNNASYDAKEYKNSNVFGAIDELLQKSMIYDAIINCHGTSYVDVAPGSYKEWRMQPVQIEGFRFNDMEAAVEFLISKGYKKILIASCNPGHYKLPDNLVNQKGIVINYSDNDNLMENTEFDLPIDQIDSILAEANKYIEELEEAYGYIDDMETIDESFISSIKEYASKAAKFVVGLFKRLWGFVVEMTKRIKDGFIKLLDKIRGKKLEKTVTAKIVVIEAARNNEYKITSPEQLKNVVMKSIQSIQKEIAVQQKMQISATEKLNQMTQKLRDDSMRTESAYEDDLLDFLGYSTVSEALVLNEAVLSSKERKDLPSTAFGLPDKRKFPLNDYDHVIMAIKFFNRCDKKDQEELAKNIIKAMKKYKVPYDKIGKNNKLRNYIPSLNESVVNEGLFKKDPYKTIIKKYKNYRQTLDCTNEIKDIENSLVPEIVKNVGINPDKIEYYFDNTQIDITFKTNLSEYDNVKKIHKLYDDVAKSKGVTVLYDKYTNDIIKYKNYIIYVWTNDEDDELCMYGFQLRLSILYCKKYADICKIPISAIETLCKSVIIYDTSLVTPEFISFSVRTSCKDEYPKIEQETGCKIIPKMFRIYVFPNNIMSESVGNPVVGLNTERQMVVDNMYNNAFTSLSVDQKIIDDCLNATAKALINKEDKFYVPYIPYISESLNIDPNIGFYKDTNGIFVMNENTGLRSPSYKDVDDIDDRTILYITYGELNDAKMNDL